MSTKKGKKKVKGKTLNLAEFQQSGEGQSTATGKNIVSVPTNWADEDVDDDFYHQEPQKVALPSAPRAAQKSIDYASLPDSPPFTVYVGNLSYDVDEDILRHFFGDKNEDKIKEVRFVQEQGRMKGFGYVEFHTKQLMIEGLEKDSETLLKRSIKIDIASGNNNRSSGFDSMRPGERGGYRDRQQQQFTSFGDDDNDWRGGSNRAPPSDYGRGYDSGRGRRDDGFGRKDDGFGRDRDDRYQRRNYDDASDSGPWTRGVSSGYNEPPRRNYNDDRNGYDRAPKREEGPPHERPRLKLAPRSKPLDETDKPTTNKPSIFGEAKPVDTASKERQIEERLHHQHIDDRGSDRQHTRDGGSGFGSRDIRPNVERRVYNAGEDSPPKPKEPEPTPPAQPKKPSFDPFGAAKPVDTAAREREIEEKLKQKELESRPAREGDSMPPRNGNPKPYRDGDSRPSYRDQSRQVPHSRDVPSKRGAKIDPPKSRSKPLPQSIEEMPTYNEDRSVEFKVDNKYAGLFEGDDGNDREESD